MSWLSWGAVIVPVVVIVAIIALAWWIEVGSARMHMRQALREQARRRGAR